MENLRLPPLNQLRVFEAAARHLSFKAAAEELCVTAPAVSHQIKMLEDHLGVKLFKRLNREVLLSKQGERYFEDVTKAINIIGKATQSLQNKGDKPRFTINTLPSIASLLLIPHIHEFQQLHPDINIQLTSDTSRADFDGDELDVAIRHQLGEEPELTYTYLDTVSVSPICSPEFFNAHPELAQADLSQSRLIRMTADPYNWDLWLSQWQVEKPQEEISLNSFHASLEATKNSIGIAMGYVPLVRRQVERNELVMPMPDKISDYGKMYFVCKTVNYTSPVFKAFEVWLQDLMAREWPDK